MTTYFVDKANGSNGNAGTTLGAAWQTLDYAASNTGLGDTVKVVGGGQTYFTTGSLVITADNITWEAYDSSVAHPILDGTSGNKGFDVNDAQGFTLRNFVIQNNPGECVYLQGNVHGFSMENCILQDSDYGLDCERLTPGTPATGTITIDNCQAIDNAKDGFSFNGSVNFTISDCIAHGHLATGVADGFSMDENTQGTFNDCVSYNNSRGFSNGDGVAPILLNRCSAYDCGDFPFLHKDSGSSVIDGGYWETSDTRGIDVRTGATLTCRNMAVLCTSTFAPTGSSAGFFCDDDSTLTVQNCSVINLAAADAASWGNQADSGTTGSTMTVTNCISILGGANAKHTNARDGVNTTLDIDYNIYGTDPATSGGRFRYNGTLRQFATWNTDGFDANGAIGDPLFKNDTGGALASFKLGATSAAIGAGEDLSGSFTTDAYNRTRSTPWDAGAITFVSDSGSGASMNPPWFQIPRDMVEDYFRR